MPPFNTAIVNGYNALTGAKVKLGRWTEYLAMRRGINDLNGRYRDLLSNDLGAIGGLLFDIGSGRYAVPPREDGQQALSRWKEELERARADSATLLRAQAQAREGDASHTEVQGWLRDLGHALGFSVWIAANDHGRLYGSGRLCDGCLAVLPATLTAADAVPLIDVLWLEPGSDRVRAAFEVEHSTSIYSGIVRMLDLALGVPDEAGTCYFLVAPDSREADVRSQLQRPAFSSIGRLAPRYLPYSELRTHREAIARFGQGLSPIEKLARSLT